MISDIAAVHKRELLLIVGREVPDLNLVMYNKPENDLQCNWTKYLTMILATT